MTRIPYPEIETLSPGKQAVFADPGRRVLNVSKMAMHMGEDLWAAQAELGRAQIFTCSLDPKLKEVLILRMAFIWDSEYEIFHHLSIAKNLGLTDEKIAALKSGDFAALDEQERAVAQFTTELWFDNSPSEETLAAVRAFLPDSTIFEMIPVMASYFITARVVAIGGVELDSEPVGVWPAKAWRKPGEVD